MKKKTIFFAIALTLVLCGCKDPMPEMTDEQATAVGEYAAITLLKYDANSRSRLVDLSKVPEKVEPPKVEPVSEPAVQPEGQETSVSETSVSKTPVIEIGETAMAPNLESFLELDDGITVVYAGEEICQSYPDDASDFFALEASQGKSLLVLNFLINNSSGSDKTIDLLNRRDVYRITVNGDYNRTALTTMLTNDMVTYMDKVVAGENANVVLLFEVDQDLADNLTSILLSVKNEGAVYSMQIL